MFCMMGKGINPTEYKLIGQNKRCRFLPKYNHTTLTDMNHIQSPEHPDSTKITPIAPQNRRDQATCHTQYLWSGIIH